MSTTTFYRQVLRKQIALPQDHGSWVFLFSPLLIGLFLGGNWKPATFYLILSAVAAFLIRQPVSMLVKALSGRRPKRDLPAAYFWTAVYAFLICLGVLGLVLSGFGYLLLLAVPGIPVFIWHLVLVSRREERRQIGVEIVGVGALSLAAPAAYWVGVGYPSPMGIWLWLLVWFQSAASIVYAYLRLEQRSLLERPDLKARLKMGQRALLYTSFNLLGVSLLAAAGILPALLPLPYALQWFETLWGTLNPAIGVKPTRIGLRQLLVSTLFTLLFVISWLLSART